MEELTTYIGVKVVQARPMEKDGKAGYKVVYPDGYESWSPKAVFEEAYRDIRTGKMTFGLAIEALKKGKKVARAGWNGQDMYLALVEGSTIPATAARSGVALEITREGAQEVNILPHIDMRAEDGSCVVGWLASQTDMLSDDWFIVD